MPEWASYKKLTVDGVDLEVLERTDRRNRHGATEYIVKSSIGGNLVYSERFGWSVWLGHCFGQLLYADVAKRAKMIHERDSSPPVCVMKCPGAEHGLTS